MLNIITLVSLKTNDTKHGSLMVRKQGEHQDPETAVAFFFLFFFFTPLLFLLQQIFKAKLFSEIP